MLLDLFSCFCFDQTIGYVFLMKTDPTSSKYSKHCKVKKKNADNNEGTNITAKEEKPKQIQ